MGRHRTYIHGIDRPQADKYCNECKQYHPMTQANFYVALRENGKYTFSAYCIPCTRRRVRKNTQTVRPVAAPWAIHNRAIEEAQGLTGEQVRRRLDK